MTETTTTEGAPAGVAARTWITVLAVITTIEGLLNLAMGAMALSEGAVPEGAQAGAGATLRLVGAGSNIIAGVLAPIGAWWLFEAGRRFAGAGDGDGDAWQQAWRLVFRYLILAVCLSLIWMASAIAVFAMGGEVAP